MKFNEALFWLAFPAIVVAACVFVYLGEREAEKKRRYEGAQG